MAFFTWGDLLAPAPPAFVTGTPSGAIARSVATGLRNARAANPYRFATGGNYSTPGPTPIWVDANSFWDEALGRVPVIAEEVPIGNGDYSTVGLVWGAVTRWYNLSTQQEIEDRQGLLDPNFTYPSQPMAYGVVAGSASLMTGIGDFKYWAFPATGPGGTGEVVISDSYGPVLWRPRGLSQIVIAPFGSTTPQPATAFPPAPQSYTPTNDPVQVLVEIPAVPDYIPTPVQIPVEIPNPEEFGRRPIPVIPAPTIPDRERRALPGITLLPDGIQVGAGRQGDPVVYTPPDIIPDTLTELQDIIREQIPGAECPEPPDPCEPVDYQRIQDSVISVLSRRVRLPGATAETSLGSPVFGTNVVIPITDDMVAISYVLDESEFTGGFRVGGRQELTFYICGWYGFRGPQSNRGHGDRYFLGTRQGSIEIPLWATAFCVNLIDGMTGTFTPVLVDPIPEA